MQCFQISRKSPGFQAEVVEKKRICVQRTYISPLIVISETVCLVKYRLCLFIFNKSPWIWTVAESSQSPRPSNTEGIHPHIFLQAPRREQGDASDAPSRRLWKVHKQVQSPKKWPFDRQTCRVYHGFTFESRIYIYIYILIYTKRAHPNFRFDRIHMNGASIFEPTDLFIFCFQLRCLFYRDEHGSDISVIPLVGQ